MRFVILILLYSSTMFASEKAALDYSLLQSQFENRITTSVRGVLNPILGVDNYTITIKTNTKKLDTDNSAIYFSKLGLSATLPMARVGDGYRFENWIDSFEVNVSYSETLSNANPKDLEKLITDTLRTLSKVKSKVTLSTFLPVHKPSLLQRIPWTPLALLFLSITIFFAFNLLAKVISGLKTEPSANAATFELGSTTTKTEKLETSTASSHSSFDGIKRWVAWVEDDLSSAEQFVDKISRSDKEEDRALIAYIFQFTELKSTKQILSSLKSETVQRIKDFAAVELAHDKLGTLDQMLTQSVTQHYVDQHLDSDNILKIIHDFTPEECVQVSSKHPEVLSLFVKYYSTPHVEQILTHIENSVLEKFLDYAENPNINWPQLAKLAKTEVGSLRAKESKKADSHVHKWIALASHLQPDKELQFYNNIIDNHGFDSIRELALENYPQFLIAELPAEILKPVLNSYPFNERAHLLYSFNAKIKGSFLQFYDKEEKVKEVIAIELELLESDLQRVKSVKAKLHLIQKEFYSRVRKYIRSSPEHTAVAEEYLKKWCQSVKGHNENKKSVA